VVLVQGGIASLALDEDRKDTGDNVDADEAPANPDHQHICSDTSAAAPSASTDSNASDSERTEAS